MNEKFVIEPLSDEHDRQGFSCANAILDRYFIVQASQDVRRRIANCFVAVGSIGVAGYYTLSASSIPITDLPSKLAKKLPRYPVMPAALVGRLAVEYGEPTFSGEVEVSDVARQMETELDAH